MARSCAICGKISIDGFNPQSRYHPNLQRATIEQKGKQVKALICTRCQRTLSRAAQ